MRVGIVGCGYVGQRRAQIVHQSSNDELVIVADVNQAVTQNLTREYGCDSTTDWQNVVAADVDCVVVSAPNKFTAPISIAALGNDKHVLCEKPMGRNLAEAAQIAEAARSSGRVLKVGFNHRYYPGVQKAQALCAAGEIGPLSFLRCVYGHGGRPGYEQEWRGDADLAGGGELLDQGVHVVDLCRWVMGEFGEVMGYTASFFWKLGTGTASQRQLEDNAFVMMRTSSGQVASWHTSWTQWKNRFVLEVYGLDGYVHLEGRGGSYSPQRLTLGKRRPESGPPDEQTWQWQFCHGDPSWEAEWEAFGESVRTGQQPMGNADDGLRNMRLLEAIYQSAEQGHPVAVSP